MTINLTIGGKTARSTLGQHTVAVEWDKLPAVSQDFIKSYGLRQYLGDAMAGEKSEADAKAKINTRLEKLLSGDLTRTKGDGSPIDTVEQRATKLVKALVARSIEAAQAKDKTLAKPSKEKIAAAVAAYLADDKKGGAIRAQAKKELDAEAALAEASMNDDAFGALFTAEDTVTESEGDDTPTDEEAAKEGGAE